MLHRMTIYANNYTRRSWRISLFNPKHALILHMQITTQEYLYLHTNAAAVQLVTVLLLITQANGGMTNTAHTSSVIILRVINHIHCTHTHLGALKQSESYRLPVRDFLRRDVEVCYTCQRSCFHRVSPVFELILPLSCCRETSCEYSVVVITADHVRHLADT